MKLSMPQLQTLKRLSNGPKTTLTFTTSETHISGAHHALNHLKNLEMNGFVVEIQDVWHMTNAGRMALMEKPQHIPRISNGTTSELYVGGNWKDKITRRGALDFLKCPSRHTATPTC